MKTESISTQKELQMSYNNIFLVFTLFISSVSAYSEEGQANAVELVDSFRHEGVIEDVIRYVDQDDFQFIAYTVKIADKIVIVSDVLSLSNYNRGEKIAFLEVRTKNKYVKSKVVEAEKLVKVCTFTIIYDETKK